jgi:hypothetical protein
MKLWLVFLLCSVAGFGQTEAAISGKVTDAVTHLAVVGADVIGLGPDIQTDANGAFSVTVKSFFYDLQRFRIKQTGFAPLETTVSKGAVQPLDLKMKPASRISGRLLDNDSGKPLAGFVVVAAAGQFINYHATSRGDGSFAFDDLAEGDYVVEISPPSVGRTFGGDEAEGEKPHESGYGRLWFPGVPRLEMASPIRLIAGEKRDIELRLPKRELHDVSGVFEVPKGGENDAIGIRVMSRGALLPSAEGEIEKAGIFRIEGLDAGSYTLMAYPKPVGEAGVAYITQAFEVTDAILTK